MQKMYGFNMAGYAKTNQSPAVSKHQTLKVPIHKRAEPSQKVRPGSYFIKVKIILSRAI